jgi:hypothetical protein
MYSMSRRHISIVANTAAVDWTSLPEEVIQVRTLAASLLLRLLFYLPRTC